MAKMTLEKARKLRHLAGRRPNPMSRKQLAERFGISTTLTGMILRGEAYPEVDEIALKRQQLLSYIGDTYEPEDDESIDEYCQIHALQQRMLAEMVDLPKMTTEYTNKAGATNDTKHPLLAEFKAYSARKTAILVSLGLTRKQRLRLGAELHPEEDGFDDL